MTNKPKYKILNDPVYGFINMPSGIIHQVIELDCFQRLRRIKQLGLTYYVYPGANHNRFQHALGAMHLMQEAIKTIKSKGHSISDDETAGAMLAILLHDIGHGPFSHSLEYSIVENITHEELSSLFMESINNKLGGALDIAIQIFKNTHPKRYLHQLVSGQLDTDRLDYLNRDSFFTGVSEGVIGSDRIIKMFDVVDEELVVEEKGIYSVEKFLIARRLMYWQVYLHKTVLSSEQLLINIMRRAKELTANGVKLFAPQHLEYFLKSNSTILNKEELLKQFSLLDDNDIITSIKSWMFCSDRILAELSKMLINRKLLKMEMQPYPFDKEYINNIKEKVKKLYNVNNEEVNYFVDTGELKNNTYSYSHENIKIKLKTGKIVDISEASAMLNLSVLSQNDKKHYLCYPKFN